MVKALHLLSRLSPLPVLVVGDLMLDSYTVGKVRRISPEAPISILNASHEEVRAGGAGNVILNLLSLGAEVHVLGRIGNDSAGERLRHLLQSEGVYTAGLFVDETFRTPIKSRYIAEAQQILRVDFEEVKLLCERLEQEMVAVLPSLLEQVAVVAVSDYGKGFLSTSFLMEIIEKTKERGIPLLIDPKGEDFTKYAGATFLKPNLGEAYVASGLPRQSTLDQVGRRLLQISHAQSLCITRGEAGMTIFQADGSRHDFPVKAQEVRDVTGAGDTVLALFTVALGNGLSPDEAAPLANVAGGIVVERVGCARITLSDLASRVVEERGDSKIFDDEHLIALEELLRNEPYTLLGMDKEEAITTSFYRTLRDLKANARLVLYMREGHSPDYIALLSSLSEIDYILVPSAKLKALWERRPPKEVHAWHDGELITLAHASELLSAT